ncbi:hypothetical protein [Shewanella surugensis]|uniref:Sulfotransferase family protein n=1 Tax=Shewanella surugensis TaxID=212020 RepID=A0ABT0L8N0_9GAMM|nr:hypothetical protein [Shewanella surugensis]MCL1124057.1 hypothetical protein [Shewanella surugensis]
MKQIFLHIGSHKTGSSSIQEALLTQQDVLHEQDFHYFDIRGPSGQSGHPSEWVMTEDVHSGSTHVLALDKLRKLFDSIEQNHIIFSNEMLSWIFRESRISHIREALRGFFVTVIVYIRRQDKQMISHHQQGSKGASPALDYYASAPRAFPSQGFYRYLNYFDKLCMWADVFGQENINIRIFEPENFEQGDVVQDFCHQIGVQGIKGVRVNCSNGFEKTKMGHLINKTLPKSELSRLLRSGLSDHGKLLPSKQQAKMMYQRYIYTNQKLNAKFNLSDQYDLSEKYDDIFNQDFSCYPDEPSDEWDETSANQAIEHLLQSLAPLAKSKLFNLLLKFYSVK